MVMVTHEIGPIVMGFNDTQGRLSDRIKVHRRRGEEPNKRRRQGRQLDLVVAIPEYPDLFPNPDVNKPSESEFEL